MKIAFLLGGLNSNGGIGRVVSIIANPLSKFHDILLLTYSDYKEDKALYNVDENISIFSLHCTKSMRHFILNGGINKVRNFVKENEVDILISCGALFFPVSVLACKNTSTKCVCWEHSNANNGADHSFQKICRWFGAKRSDACVVLTKQDYSLYTKKFNPSILMQIYNPVDDKIKYCYSPQNDQLKIISVGRLTYQKNYPLLVDIADTVLKDNPNWSWSIYGEGDERVSIQSKIDALGLNGRLVLKGQVSNLYDLYSEHSFYVLTSRYEGFSMALLEAIRSGLPIVAFDVECGPREVIEDGKNGYLIAPFDKDLMIKRINELCNNHKKCLSMSRESYKMSEKFTIDPIIAQWNKLFLSLKNHERK